MTRRDPAQWMHPFDSMTDDEVRRERDESEEYWADREDRSPSWFFPVPEKDRTHD
jgi:hypothetical protein